MKTRILTLCLLAIAIVGWSAVVIGPPIGGSSGTGLSTEAGTNIVITTTLSTVKFDVPLTNIPGTPRMTNFSQATHTHTNEASGGIIYRPVQQTKLIAAGDSMTAYNAEGYGVWFSWLLRHTNVAGKVAAINLAKPGDSVDDQLPGFWTKFGPYLPKPGERAIVLSWIGINEDYTPHTSGSFSNMVVTNLVAYWSAFKTNGCEVAAMTMFNYTTSNYPDKSNTVDNVNEWIRSLTPGVGYGTNFDYLLDPDAYRKTNAWASPSSSDGLHPTRQFYTNFANYIATNTTPVRIDFGTNVWTGLSTIGEVGMFPASDGAPVMRAYGDIFIHATNDILWYNPYDGQASDGIRAQGFHKLKIMTYGQPRWTSDDVGRIGYNLETGVSANHHFVPALTNYDIARFDTYVGLSGGYPQVGIPAFVVSSNGTIYMGTNANAVLTNSMFGVGTTNPQFNFHARSTGMPALFERDLTVPYLVEAFRVKAKRSNSAVSGWGPAIVFASEATGEETNTGIASIAVISDGTTMSDPSINFNLGSSYATAATMGYGGYFGVGITNPTHRLTLKAAGTNVSAIKVLSCDTNPPANASAVLKWISITLEDGQIYKAPLYQ